MERKKLNDKRSRSARCAHQRTMRVCFAVMTIVLLVSAMVAPASALIIDHTVYSEGTLLSGTVNLQLTDTPDEIASDNVWVSFPFGGRVPWIDIAATNTAVEQSKLMLPLDSGFYYSQTLAMARRDLDLNLGTSVYGFDTYRYNYSHNIVTADGTSDKAYYITAKYDFDPAYFPIFTQGILENLFVLRFKQGFQVTCSVTYSWLGLDNKIHTDSSIRYQNVGMAGAETISGLLPRNIMDIMEDVGSDPAGAGLYIEDMVVTVNPLFSTGTKASGIVFDMLTDVWTTNVPNFYKDNPSKTWFDEVQRFMEQNVGGSGGGGIPEYPSVEESPFMEFIVSAVGTFFDTDIMPGFSLGGVFSVVFMIVVIILILKFFAGG